MSAPAGSGALIVAGLRKRYGSTIALDGLDLEIRPGEVLGIAGPNGAGKSTLVRMLAGEERPDSGAMTLSGEPWEPHLPGARVAVVHQEPQLFPNLTVAQNMLAGREGTRVARPRLAENDRLLMEAVGIGGFADTLLEDVTLATQQRTEIARALARNARLFLFDEPNSALTDEESNELFSQMHEIAAGGRLVVLITHRLGDLATHAKRVAVVRDGQVRAVLEGEALTEEGIAQQLVLGGERGGDAPAARAKAASSDGSFFSASHWTHRKGVFADIDLRVGRGEIVALMGVEGSGARELLRSFAGLEKAGGSLSVAGSSENAHRLTAYVPATRQRSLYSNFTVGENLLVRLGQPDIAGPILNLRRRHMRQLAEDAVRRFLVKTRTITQMIRSLSGGNQQKVAIAQALAADPRLILLEEPTRGVDIQSKREIYRLLREYAAAGNAVLIFCTEVLEVFEAADRVIVVSDGRLSPSLAIGDHTHVEVLATAISRLERHSRQVPAAA